MLPVWMTSLRQEVKITEALCCAAQGIRLIILNGGEFIVNGAMYSSERLSEFEVEEQHILSSKTLVSTWPATDLDMAD